LVIYRGAEKENYSFNIFVNRYNTMIDYNPSDQKLYSWDNGRRVVYHLTMKKGSIEKEITTNLNKT